MPSTPAVAEAIPRPDTASNTATLASGTGLPADVTVPTTDAPDTAATGGAHTEDPTESSTTNNPVSNHRGNPTNITLARMKPSLSDRLV